MIIQYTLDYYSNISQCCISHSKCFAYISVSDIIVMKRLDKIGNSYRLETFMTSFQHLMLKNEIFEIDFSPVCFELTVNEYFLFNDV